MLGSVASWSRGSYSKALIALANPFFYYFLLPILLLFFLIFFVAFFFFFSLLSFFPNTDIERLRVNIKPNTYAQTIYEYKDMCILFVWHWSDGILRKIFANQYFDSFSRLLVYFLQTIYVIWCICSLHDYSYQNFEHFVAKVRVVKFLIFSWINLWHFWGRISPSHWLKKMVTPVYDGILDFWVDLVKKNKPWKRNRTK